MKKKRKVVKRKRKNFRNIEENEEFDQIANKYYTISQMEDFSGPIEDVISPH